MKPSKITISLLLIIISFVGHGQASTKEKVSGKAIAIAKKSDAMMKESLKLTKEQIPAVSKINLDFSKKMVALFEKPGSMFGKIGEMKQTGKDRNTLLEKVLTSEQMELFEDKVESKIRKEARKIMKQDS